MNLFLLLFLDPRQLKIVWKQIRFIKTTQATRSVCDVQIFNFDFILVLLQSLYQLLTLQKN